MMQVIMQWPGVLVFVVGAILLVGFALGLRVSEHFLRVRERQVARQRRSVL